MRRLCVLLLAYALALHVGLAAVRPMADAKSLCHSQAPGTPRDHPAPPCHLCCRLAGPAVALPASEGVASLDVCRNARPADWRPAVPVGSQARAAPVVRARGPPGPT